MCHYLQVSPFPGHTSFMGERVAHILYFELLTQCNFNGLKLCLYLLIIGHLTAEVDSFSTNCIPDIMKEDKVLGVFIYLYLV